MTISEIEIAKSSNAGCKFCGKLMGKGTPRGIEYVKGGTYTSERYYCWKCTKIKLKEQIEYSKKLQKELTKSIIKNQKAILLHEL